MNDDEMNSTIQDNFNDSEMGYITILVKIE